MVKKKVKYKRRSGKQVLSQDLRPESIPDINPDDIEIGDEIGPAERLRKNEEEH